MKKILMTIVLAVTAVASYASDRHSRLMIGTGLLYPNTWDTTVSCEYETRYHNAWEFFANASLRWDDCRNCGHVCPKSFWHGYRTWGFGMAWKPCVVRGHNHYGNLRVGASLGSDMHKVLGGFHLGYEHSYALRNSWQVFWQVKTDLMVNGDPLFRTGCAIGVKIAL